MKSMLIAILLLAATPANAALSDGMWYSVEGQIEMSFSGWDFTVYESDTDTFVPCKIVSWPLSSPIAKGECENGDNYDLEIRVDGLKVNGFEMTQTLEGMD
jgi:hypothetical protein